MSNVPVQYSLWTIRSINKYFDTALGDVHKHFEGYQRDTEDKSEWFEVRLDGPSFKQFTQTDFRAYIQINILAVMVEQNNALRLREMLALAANAMEHCLPVYKYGSIEIDPLNTQELIGCYHRSKEEKRDLDIAFFGKLQPQTAMQQGSVESSYYWDFTLE